MVPIIKDKDNVNKTKTTPGGPVVQSKSEILQMAINNGAAGRRLRSPTDNESDQQTVTMVTTSVRPNTSEPKVRNCNKKD